MITKTQERQFEGHKTPHKLSPLWFGNPPNEDREDKKTPNRVRDIKGDFYVLVEQVNYLIFPEPDVRAALKAAGKPCIPGRVEQYFIHTLHSLYLTTRTLKIYRHGTTGKVIGYRKDGSPIKEPRYFYSDSLDVEIVSARKSGPEKGRDNMVGIMSRMFGLTPQRADELLSDWTCGK